MIIQNILNCSTYNMYSSYLLHIQYIDCIHGIILKYSKVYNKHVLLYTEHHSIFLRVHVRT